MAMDWNNTGLPWQDTGLPWKSPFLTWNDVTIPWKQGGTTVFDPNNKSDHIILSNGNLTCTSVGSLPASARATVGKSSGKFYCELKINVKTGDPGVGLCNALHAFTGGAYLGSSNNSVSLFTNVGQVYLNGALVTTLVAFAANDTVCMASDVNNRTIWWRKNNGNWNNSAPANPSTNVGGIDISAISGSLFPGVDIEAVSDQLTANFGASTYAFTAPSGFANWG